MALSEHPFLREKSPNDGPKSRRGGLEGCLLLAVRHHAAWLRSEHAILIEPSLNKLLNLAVLAVTV
jgi:hypothetical protein